MHTPSLTTPVVLSRRFMGSFILLTILAGLGVGVARILTSLYAVQLNASELQLGLISAGQSIGILLMALPMAVLVQRWGAFKVFTLGSLLGASLYALMPIYANPWYVLLVTALVSFILPMRFLSINTVFLSHLRKLGPARAGWFRGAHMMGFFLIAPMLTIFLSQYTGYQYSFWWVAVLFLAACAFAPWCFAQQAVNQQAKFVPSEILAPLKLLKQHSALRMVCWLEFLSSVVNHYFGFFIVVIALQVFALSESIAVMLLTTQGIVFVASLFGLGGLAEMVGYQKFYLIGLSFIGVSLLLLALSQYAVWLWPAVVLLGLGLGMLHIANFMAFAKVGEQTKMTQVSPILAIVAPIGGLFAGLLGGLLGGDWGLQILFLPLAIIFIGLIFWVYRDQHFSQFLSVDAVEQQMAKGQSS